MAHFARSLTLMCAVALVPLLAADGSHAVPMLFGKVPIEFILFACTLLGVALFHHYTLQVAVTGLVVIAGYKLGFSNFHGATGAAALGAHFLHEWVTLANLLGLLLGFDILAHHFSSSKIPAMLPRFLPDDWKGGFVLLILVFVISSFLDNIAAAMIGGTVAASVFKGRVHIGYLAGIVAASNAGGSGSVVGDTTTTMMWIDGVSPLDVTHAYVAAVVALIFSGVVASLQQHKYQPILKDPSVEVVIDWGRVAVVAVILASAMGANIAINVYWNSLANSFPWIGTAVWLAILIMTPVRKPHWAGVPSAAKGAAFLLSLVLCASMMPVEELPKPSWHSAFGLGFVSAVFDNIPLTALALKQGGYDWGMLAYCVGFGGSMIWFGSSAGVAISNSFSQARSVGAWLKHGWHVAVAYVLGFFVLLLVMGWEPHATHKESRPGSKAHESSVSPDAAHPTSETPAVTPGVTTP